MENQPKEKNAYILHFERELEIMRKQVPEDDQLIIEPYVEAMKGVMEAFAKEGHSGGSAPYAASAIAHSLKAVLGFQILSPLTGEDDEWVMIDKRISGGNVHYQNVRDGGVFKDENGNCSYNTAIVWQGEDDWDTFTGSLFGIRSSQYIKEFPFMPKTFYVNVRREPYDPNNPEHNSQNVVSCGPGDMCYFLKDPKQLDAVFQYYNKRELNLKSNEQ